jgi:hypothetical protein
VKPIWEFSAKLGGLSIVWAIIFFMPSFALGTESEKLACVLVQCYGSDIGGEETVGSLIELNMRDWKPQSDRGIEIFGWNSKPLGNALYQVTYSYVEHGRAPVVLAWTVDVTKRKITPKTELSGRLMQMAKIF